MDKDGKKEIIELISKIEDDVLLNQVKAILEGSQIELWDELTPALKESIQRGINQSTQNEVTPHHEVMSSYRKPAK